MYEACQFLLYEHVSYAASSLIAEYLREHPMVDGSYKRSPPGSPHWLRQFVDLF